jgi:hypothetical protein
MAITIKLPSLNAIEKNALEISLSDAYKAGKIGKLI